MPTYLGYEILDQTVLNVESAGRNAKSILEAEFGDDYRVSANVGNIGGVRSGQMFTISAGVWPDDESISTVEGVSAFEYYWEFFNDRIDNGNEPFIIEWRNRYWTVDLAEPNIAVEVHTADLFTPQGIQLRRRAIQGVEYYTDGSLGVIIVDTTPPSVPTGLTIDAEAQYAITISWTASTD